MAASLRQLTFTLAPNTIVWIFRTLQNWFSYLDTSAPAPIPINRLEDISQEILEGYVSWLLTRTAKTKTGKAKYSTARTAFSALRTVLMQSAVEGKISVGVFPKKPFPTTAALPPSARASSGQ
ncbi:phage integrase SAM-like domain-containing protein [Caballeronia sp. INML2]|uniref:phage integrase SAM-like domain-containing protein n=1 Tax=Caballeronia sp. INML2 TaxID=2921748 RepID=UPI0020297829|nr:phage integrase SAM-like domain-containing protein [Caballeronia sp. INML2]